MAWRRSWIWRWGNSYGDNSLSAGLPVAAICGPGPLTVALTRPAWTGTIYCNGGPLMTTITGPGGLRVAEIIGPGPFKIAISGPPGPVIARTGYRMTGQPCAAWLG